MVRKQVIHNSSCDYQPFFIILLVCPVRTEIKCYHHFLAIKQSTGHVQVMKEKSVQHVQFIN